MTSFLAPFGLLLVFRFLRLILLLGAVALTVFVLMKLSPLDPIDAYLGPAMAQVGPEQRAFIAGSWGLDQPVPVQFGRWLQRILVGDLGWSTTYNASVAETLAERVIPSLMLTVPAWLLSGLLGFSLGILAGMSEGSFPDRIVRTYVYLAASAPTFWVAILLLALFSVWLRWTPLCCAGPIGVPTQDVTSWQRVHHLILPLGVLSLIGIAQVALHTRVKVIEIMQSDFVLFAKAQGATTADITLHHVVRNAALPALTILLVSIGEILSGAVLAEQVFAYPGLGRATVEAGVKGDVPLLLAVTLLATLVVSTGNLVADLLYRVVDPRIARGGATIHAGDLS